MTATELLDSLLNTAHRNGDETAHRYLQQLRDPVNQLAGDFTAWAADALNCRQALRSILKYHPESPETGAELPREYWHKDYLSAVEYAEKCLAQKLSE